MRFIQALTLVATTPDSNVSNLLSTYPTLTQLNELQIKVYGSPGCLRCIQSLSSSAVCVSPIATWTHIAFHTHPCRYRKVYHVQRIASWTDFRFRRSSSRSASKALGWRQEAHSHWTKICKVCPEVCNADVAPNLTKRVAATPVSVFWKNSHWAKDSWFPMHIRSLLEASHKSLPMPMPYITSSQLQPLDLRLLDLHLEQFQNLSKKKAQICPSSQLKDLSHRQSTMFHSDLQDIAETWLRSQRAEGDDPGASVKHVNL